MQKKLLIIFTTLLLVLIPAVSRTFAVSTWDGLTWLDIPGDVPALVDKNPDGQNVPNDCQDIVGSIGSWPARYAIDETYIYFELRVAEYADDAQWMVLFFPPGVTTLDPQGNFNDVFLLAGLTANVTGHVTSRQVLLATIGGPGHNRTVVQTYGESYFEIIEGSGDDFVRWKIPLADLYQYITAPVYYTLASGNSNNNVPNKDWFGWNTLVPPAAEYTLTLDVNPAGTGTASGGGDYAEGTEVLLTATANTGYVFVNWTDALGSEVSTQAQFTYTMPAGDTTLTANFAAEPVPDYTLTLDVNPAGTGTASGGGDYAEGTEVLLTATANTGYVFVNWTDALGGEVSDQAQFTYTMPGADTNLTANFEAEPVPEYTLTLNVAPAGTGTASGGGDYAEGTEVLLTATANAGYVFVNWTDAQGGEVSTQAQFTYTMPAEDTTLTANFTAVPVPRYTLSLQVSPAGTGTASGGGAYTAGTEVVLTAAANAGYVFVNWTDTQGSEVSTQAQFTYTMPAADTTLTANFAAVPVPRYTLSLQVSPAGTGTASGGGAYTAGTEVVLTAAANAGYVFVNWTGALGSVVSTQAQFTYTMPAANTTLTANFAAAPVPTYNLGLQVAPGGSGTVTGAGVYSAGAEVVLNAAANAGYEFVNWTDAGGNKVSDQAQFAFTMPAADTTLIANFQDYSRELPITGTNVFWLTPLGLYLIIVGLVLRWRYLSAE